MSDWLNNFITDDAANAVIKETVSTQLPGRGHGPADAFRHVLLAAELTRNQGELDAKLVLDWKEVFDGGDGISSTSMDEYNNLIGIEIGSYVRKEGGTFKDVIRLTQNLLQASLSNVTLDDIKNINPRLVTKTENGNILIKGEIKLENGLTTNFISILPVDSWEGNPLVNGQRISNENANWPDESGNWKSKFVPETYDYPQGERVPKILNKYCFPAGTHILISEGTYKPIEEIQVGDEVMAFDGLGELQPRRVTQTFITPDQEVVQLGNIRVTPGHHFLMPDGSFKAIGEVDANGFLVGVTGKLIPHPGIQPVPGKHTVYNFTVEDLHTYVAGDYRVHNESLSLYQTVSELGSIGSSIGGKIALMFADENKATQLVAESTGKTLGGWVGDAIDYELAGRDALQARALIDRLPGSFVSTAVSMGSSAISQTIIDVLNIDEPLAQIGVSSVTAALTQHYFGELVLATNIDYKDAVKYFGLYRFK